MPTAAFAKTPTLTSTPSTVSRPYEKGGSWSIDLLHATSGGQPATAACGASVGEFRRATALYNDQLRPRSRMCPPPRRERTSGAGDSVTLKSIGDRRYARMRYTRADLLSAVRPYPFNRLRVNEDDSRLDFDIPEAGSTKTRSPQSERMIKADARSNHAGSRPGAGSHPALVKTTVNLRWHRKWADRNRRLTCSLGGSCAAARLGGDTIEKKGKAEPPLRIHLPESLSRKVGTVFGRDDA